MSKPFTDAELAERRLPLTVDEEAEFLVRLPGRMAGMGHSEGTSAYVLASLTAAASTARRSGQPLSCAAIEQGARLITAQTLTLARLRAQGVLPGSANPDPSTCELVCAPATT